MTDYYLRLVHSLARIEPQREEARAKESIIQNVSTSSSSCRSSDDNDDDSDIAIGSTGSQSMQTNNMRTPIRSLTTYYRPSPVKKRIMNADPHSPLEQRRNKGRGLDALDKCHLKCSRTFLHIPPDASQLGSCVWCSAMHGRRKRRTQMCTDCGACLCATIYCGELYHTDPKLYDEQLKDCLTSLKP